MLSSLEELYREVILDYARKDSINIDHPIASAVQYNPACGDVAYVAVAGEGERLWAGVKVEGCIICQASGSMLQAMVTNLSAARATVLVDDVYRLIRTGQEDHIQGHHDLLALGGVRRYPARVKCALLPWLALDEALRKLA